MSSLRFSPRARSCALLLAGAALLFGQPAGQAQATRPPLKLFKNYFLTGGDFRVGGVGLRGQGDPATRMATGSISLDKPVDDPNADISAAFLYWATIEPKDTLPMSADGLFNGRKISGKVISPSTRVPGCWGSGGGGGATSATTQLRVYRADILKDFPVSTEPGTLGKLLVNGTYEVKLPDSGGGGTQSPSSGNQVQYVEGASIVVVFRVPKAPLRAVVIYDGGVTVDNDEPSMQLTVGGYYDATAGATARMAHLVGDGNLRGETLTVNDNVVGGSNPISGSLGSAWDNPVYTVAPHPVTGTIDDAGIPTGVSFSSPSIDCLSWAGVVVSIDAQDGDGDGIPDRVEAGTATVPAGEPPLPDFPALGASPTVPDLFVELGFFTSQGWPDGSVGAHDHRPTANALAMAARAFKKAGINAHFDVGIDTDNRYPDRPTPAPGDPDPCGSLTTWSPGCAIVPPNVARGGEFVTETACGAFGITDCTFPRYPGTVGWKTGYQYYRDAPVTHVAVEDIPAGSQLSAGEEKDWEESCEDEGKCPPRRRFDADRHDFFHYSLWAHALGLPQGSCTLASGLPDPDCKPVRSSGFGDVGGGDNLITLGAFGFNHNGSDVTQAGTFMHELGHNFERRHGGEVLERNCKPNYLSVMSYLFQVHGMNGGIEVDFSGQVLNPLNESALKDGPLTVVGASGVLPSYATRWYAPLSSSFIQKDLLVTVPPRRCDGSDNIPAENMVRVDGLVAGAPIDWLNDGAVVTTVTLSQDGNFDGAITPDSQGGAALKGSDDWSYIKAHGLRQVAGRPNMGLSSLDMSVTDLGRGDPGRGDPGTGPGDPGRGDPGRGDPGRGDPGRGDPGRGDPGRGDPGRGDPGAPPDQGDLTVDHANAIFNGPTRLSATKVARTVELNWTAPQWNVPGQQVLSTSAYRVEGGTITKANWANRKLVGTTFSASTTIVDTKPLSNKLATYIVVVDFVDLTRSGISNPASIIYK